MLRTQLTVLGCWGLATIGETTSFLIEAEGGNILLDMCPGVTRQLKRIDFDTTNLDVAFGSHSHADHILGATYLTFQRSVEERDIPADRRKTLKYIGSKVVLEAIEATLKIHYPDRAFPIDSLVIDGQFCEIQINDRISMKFCETDHMPGCYAARVSFMDSGTVIVFTSDGLFNASITELAKGADLLIGEAFGTMSDYADVYRKVKHSLGIHLGELAREAGVKSVLPFHMHPKYATNPSKKNELLSEIRQNYDGPIIWPGDLRSMIV